MPAFGDYLDLRLAVAEHVGNQSISDVFPRLVQMAEARLNKTLRMVEQITPVTLAFTSGEANLPADFLEFLHVYDSYGGKMRQGGLQEAKRPWTHDTIYSVSGSKIYVNGFTGNKQAEYYAALPSLTTSMTATNWLLSACPDVYLYATAYEAAKHLQDAERAQAIDGLLKGALMEAKIDDDRHRWGDARVQVQMVTP